MIEIDQITKLYDEKPAVDSVSMTFEAGTITVFVGTSGSGKTTRLCMINRLVEPTTGVVQINGVLTGTVPTHVLRRRIGYAIQGHGLFQHHTVARNIGAVQELLGWTEDKIRARVDDLLTIFFMEPAQFCNRYPADLSGGQQQRVGVALALASRPDVLLIDEPFGALDLFIVVTHDMERLFI
jgi:osmoprotectant transport system ATP-binding protein